MMAVWEIPAIYVLPVYAIAIAVGVILIFKLNKKQDEKS